MQHDIHGVRPAWVMGQFELRVWADTDPTFVAYGTPAIDVELP